MKPPPFEYAAPATLEDALGLLADGDDGTRVLAGGQSLVPLLNLRLARPDRVVDINGVAELDYLRVTDDALRIGALTRQATLEGSAEVAARAPLLTQAVRFVGHPQIRNRGTVGGSIAHADPAAELPVALAALDARFHLRSLGDRRMVRAEDMFVSHYATALEATELLIEIEVPLERDRAGTSFVEVARRDGDFALAAAAATVTLATDGAWDRVTLALAAAAERPYRATDAEAWLRHRAIDEQTARAAAGMAVEDARPPSDAHASADTRRRLLAVVAARALLEAAGRAGLAP